MSGSKPNIPAVGVALRKESVDRNPSSATVTINKSESLSARRAWIEIRLYCRCYPCNTVALRKESVDRNFVSAFDVLAVSVALRKESVDRNTYYIGRFLKCCVALRKESVDRNLELSPWGAGGRVALRKESVDRNGIVVHRLGFLMSRSPQGERG